MAKLTIRCHPLTPASHDELESWLEDQVGELRASAPHAIVRLSRLTQELPGGQVEIGWLLEFELLDGSTRRVELADKLANAIRDMRLLGLQPTVLTPLDISEWLTRPAGGAAPDGSPVMAAELS